MTLRVNAEQFQKKSPRRPLIVAGHCRRLHLCCDRVDAAATELMLRGSTARVPPRGAAASLLEVLSAAPRGGTRRHLVQGRELLHRCAASAPSQQHQLRRSSSCRRQQCPATMSGRWGFSFEIVLTFDITRRLHSRRF